MLNAKCLPLIDEKVFFFLFCGKFFVLEVSSKSK